MSVYKCSCCHKKFDMKYVSKRNLLCLNCGGPAYLLEAKLDYDEFEEHVRKYGIRESV